MHCLIKLLILFVIFTSCEKEKVSKIEPISFMSDLSCLEDWEVNVDSSMINFYTRTNAIEDAIADFEFNYSVNHFCDICEQSIFDTLFNRFKIAAPNHSLMLDNNMLMNYSDYSSFPILSWICQDSILRLKSFIIFNLHHAVDSQLIYESERDLMEDFVNDMYYDISNVDLCDFKYRWDTLTKKSPGNGIVSAALIVNVASFASHRPIYNEYYNLDPETTEGFIIKWLKRAAMAWAGAMKSIYEKGCEGLQQPSAGNMLMNDMLDGSSFAR